MSNKKTIDNKLALLHELQCNALIKKLEQGEEISTADLNAVTNFLKANSITSDSHTMKEMATEAEKIEETRGNTIPFNPEDLGIVNNG